MAGFVASWSVSRDRSISHLPPTIPFLQKLVHSVVEIETGQLPFYVLTAWNKKMALLSGSMN